MPNWLKQSTSVDVGIGPFLDETDGKTAKTALTITQPDIRLKKNGGAWAQKNAAQTLTHEEAGWYEVTLDATDTGTLGILIVAIHESGALPVWKEYLVVPANVYDSIVSGTDKLDVNVEEWNATSVPAEHTAGYPIVTVKDGTGTGEIDTTSGGVLVSALAANTITATSIAADAITDAKVAADVTIASVTGAVGSVTAMVTANTIQISGDATAADNLETMLDGTGGQTLSLKSLVVSNSTGTAVSIASTGSNGYGMSIVGHGSGEGVLINGGTTADGANIISGGGNTYGLSLAGAGTGKGMISTIEGDITGSLSGSVGSVGSGGITSASFAAGAINAAAIAADAIGASELAADAVAEIQSGLSTLTAAGVRTAVGLASANLDTQLGAIDDFLDTEIGEIKTATDRITALRMTVLDDLDAMITAQVFTAPALANAPTGGSAPSAATIAAAVWSEATRTITGGTIGTITGVTLGNVENMASRFLGMIELNGGFYRYTIAALAQAPAGGGGGGAALAEEVETGWTLGEVMRCMSAVLLGKSSSDGTVFRDLNDTADRVTAVMDGFDRTSVTLDPD